MSQHCRANPCCGERPCEGVPQPQHASGLVAKQANDAAWRQALRGRPASAEPQSKTSVTTSALVSAIKEASTLSPVIAARQAELVAARKMLALDVHNVQATCDHLIVSEEKQQGSFSGPFRICNHCRVVVEGTRYCYGDRWYPQFKSASTLSNDESRIVKHIDSQDLSAMRIENLREPK